MKEFEQKVGVITGTTSGIGCALAKRCVQEGIKVVLVDIESDGLFNAENELKSIIQNVLSILTDV